MRFDFKSLAKELFRITKDGGVVVWVVGDQTINGSETGTSFKQALYFKYVGFNLHDTMICLKDGQGSTGSNKSYWQNFEYMFVFSKKDIKCFNLLKDRKNLSGILPVKKRKMGHRNKDNSIKGYRKYGSELYGIRFNTWKYNNYNAGVEHPAIFPEQLARDHILSWSNEGDLILDPMCGSGTTCKMATLLNRNYIGIDISEKYIEEICRPRIKEAQRQTRIEFK